MDKYSKAHLQVISEAYPLAAILQALELDKPVKVHLFTISDGADFGRVHAQKVFLDLTVGQSWADNKVQELNAISEFKGFDYDRIMVDLQ